MTRRMKSVNPKMRDDTSVTSSFIAPYARPKDASNKEQKKPPSYSYTCHPLIRTCRRKHVLLPFDVLRGVWPVHMASLTHNYMHLFCQILLSSRIIKVPWRIDTRSQSLRDDLHQTRCCLDLIGITLASCYVSRDLIRFSEHLYLPNPSLGLSIHHSCQSMHQGMSAIHPSLMSPYHSRICSCLLSRRLPYLVA